MTFDGFRGRREEIEFIVNILESALVLELMFLSPLHVILVWVYGTKCGGFHSMKENVTQSNKNFMGKLSLGI